MSSFAEICPKSQTESMIYGYGTLKFICMDTPVLHRCIELNLVPIMALHLKVLNNEVSQVIKKRRTPKKTYKANKLNSFPFT